VKESALSESARQVSVLLVANRGEIARRIIRTARSLALTTVAVYSEPDSDAVFVREADRAVPLGGATAAETYLDIDKLLSAARLAGADALHPGYGFLAESPELARACEAAGLVFVGPSADVIESMANKIEAKQIAERAGVPVLPTGLLTGPDDPQAQRIAADVGFPLMVKAAAGGGGKGMRLVAAAAELPEALAGAAREALAAFGNGSLFLERYVGRARHVEVQVLADRHGNVVHLLDRDCSTQRRHQKVIEEAPAPFLVDKVRSVLRASSVALAREIGYVGAGTVEFLVDGEEAYFLEMNTRLQVEHPVTEEVVGLDLVQLQLEVARGEILPISQDDVVASGHAVEVRVYAERPASGWLPSTGTVEVYEEPAGPGIRVDSAIAAGAEISPYYDSMIAKVVAHGANRTHAFGRLRRALAGYVLLGVETNLDFLRAACADPDLLSTPQPTSWLDAREDLSVAAPPLDVVQVHAALATLVHRHEEHRRTGRLPDVPTGWHNVPGAAQPTRWSFGDRVIEVRVASTGRGPARVEVDGRVHDLKVVRVGSDLIDAEVDGLRWRRRVFTSGRAFLVVGPEWQTNLTLEVLEVGASAALASGSCTAPLPATVLRVDVQPGMTVAEGDPLCVLESMKMEHVVRAPATAVVEDVRVSVGVSVALGEVLVVLKEGTA
jgi:propionyl-CoA carboxylase alpha chain